MSSPVIAFALAVKPFADGQIAFNLSAPALILVVIFSLVVWVAVLGLALTQWVALFKFLFVRGGACEMSLTVRPYQRL